MKRYSFFNSRWFWFIGVALTLTGCQPGQSEKTAQTASISQEGGKQCYASFQNRDTIILTLVPGAGDSVTGTMIYQLYEKDRNVGMIKGAKKGDILWGDYIFQSEGVSSIRQVAFKVQDSTLVEGFGPVTEEGGQVRFENPEAVQFDGHVVLHEMECL